LYISYNIGKLEILDISFNLLGSAFSLRVLALCPKLKSLSIAGNPVTQRVKEWKPRIISFLPNLLEIDGIELARGRVMHRTKNSEALSRANLESPGRLAFYSNGQSVNESANKMAHNAYGHMDRSGRPQSRDGRWGMSNARSVRSSSPALFPGGGRSRSASPATGRMTAKEQRARDEERSREYTRKEAFIEYQRAQQNASYRQRASRGKVVSHHDVSNLVRRVSMSDFGHEVTELHREMVEDRQNHLHSSHKLRDRQSTGTTSHRRGSFFGLYKNHSTPGAASGSERPTSAPRERTSSPHLSGHVSKPGTGRGRMSVIERAIPGMHRPGRKQSPSPASSVPNLSLENPASMTKGNHRGANLGAQRRSPRMSYTAGPTHEGADIGEHFNWETNSTTNRSNTPRTARIQSQFVMPDCDPTVGLTRIVNNNSRGPSRSTTPRAGSHGRGHSTPNTSTHGNSDTHRSSAEILDADTDDIPTTVRRRTSWVKDILDSDVDLGVQGMWAPQSAYGAERQYLAETVSPRGDSDSMPSRSGSRGHVKTPGTGRGRMSVIEAMVPGMHRPASAKGTTRGVGDMGGKQTSPIVRGGATSTKRGSFFGLYKPDGSGSGSQNASSRNIMGPNTTPSYLGNTSAKSKKETAAPKRGSIIYRTSRAAELRQSVNSPRPGGSSESPASGFGSTSQKRGSFFGLYKGSNGDVSSSPPSKAPPRGQANNRHVSKPGTGRGRMSVIEASIPGMHRPGRKASPAPPPPPDDSGQWTPKHTQRVPFSSGSLETVGVDGEESDAALFSPGPITMTARPVQAKSSNSGSAPSMGTARGGNTSQKRGSFFGLYSKKSNNSTKDASPSSIRNGPNTGAGGHVKVPGTGRGRMSMLEQTVSSMYKPGQGQDPLQAQSPINLVERWVNVSMREIDQAVEHVAFLLNVASKGNVSHLDIDSMKSRVKSFELLTFFDEVKLPTDVQVGTLRALLLFFSCAYSFPSSL
jgi:hypothetical protein